MKILKDLFLALLNATLMLAIILVVLCLLLVSRVSGIAANTGEAARAALSAPAARLERIEATLADIKSGSALTAADGAKIDALSAGIQMLNDQLAEMRVTLNQIPLQQIALNLRDEFGRALSAQSPGLE